MELREYLESLTLDELVVLCCKQNDKIAEIRGYATGMTPNRFRLLGKEVLIECFIKDEKNFNLHTVEL